MSHFAVAVITDGTKTLKEIMAPFQENNMGDCPKEYLVFNSVQEECETDYEKEDDEIKLKYPTLEEYVENYHGYKKDLEKNEYGYWENPNKQWDWYQVGGRWAGSLLVKSNVESLIGEKSFMDRSEESEPPESYKWVDGSRIKDVDFELMKSINRSKFESLWEEAEKESGPKKYFMYGVKNDDTKEFYIERNANFSTFSVITQDGKWNEKGEMGWFGISSETTDESNKWNKSFYDTFLKNENQDLMIIMVDCHI